MGRANVTAAGFALAGGSPADLGGIVHVDPASDRHGRLLLACVEPVDHSQRGAELAALALRVLCERFAATPGAAADALLAGFAAANAAIVAENHAVATGDAARRLCVGATAVVVMGREITVAQVPPSQTILVQDRQIYAFPELASWRGDFEPAAPLLDVPPLGESETASPLLYQSEAMVGDAVVLCSTSIGRALSHDEAAVIELHNGSLLSDDLEGSVDRLERLAACDMASDAFAVVATIARLRGGIRTVPIVRRRVRAAMPQPAVEDKPAEAAIASVPDEEPTTSQSPVNRRARLRPLPLPERPRFEGLRDLMIDVAELLSAARRVEPPRYDARQRALAAPGALSVRRYRESTGLPAEWRANLPRGPGLHVHSRLLALSLILFLALGGTGIAVGRLRDREAQAQAALVTADIALQNALDSPGTAMSAVAEAERAVDAARAAGASAEALAERERELAAERDRVWNVQRLSDVRLIGALPNDAGNGSVRLGISGRTLYLAAGNLYELDLDGDRLMALLSQGSAVNGGTVGDLRQISINGGHVEVSDGEANYVRDEKGDWQRQLLAVAQVGGLRPETPLIAWGDASYGISWDGNIIRFDQSSSGPLETIWANEEETPDLSTARDMAIDGRIHVLLDDGRTLTFSHGALVATTSPFVMPALQHAAFLAEAPFANDFYIVDREGRIGDNAGRILRVDATGNARQILAPAPTPGDPASADAAVALAAADDLAIDELSGTVYWVGNREIWSARLSSQ
jgi:hypothetical protein